MQNVNRVTMVGRLATDPEKKVVSSGKPMTTFTLATNYSWKDENNEWLNAADFHRVVVWKKLAEIVAAEYTKGVPVFLEGKLRSRSWVDDEGNKQWVTEVVAKYVEMIQPQHQSTRATENPFTSGEEEVSLSAEELLHAPDAEHVVAS